MLAEERRFRIRQLLSAQHTVTADDGSFDGGPLATGATFSQTFSTAGTFSYHCKIHPSMTATITVS